MHQFHQSTQLRRDNVPFGIHKDYPDAILINIFGCTDLKTELMKKNEKQPSVSSVFSVCPENP